MGETILNPSTDNGGIQDGTSILNEEKVYCE